MRDPASLLAWSCATLSKTAARPCPPPMHMVSSPYRAPRRFSSRASVASIRPPVAPTGCPSEMPEPCTFVRSRSAAANFHSRITASAWAANASLSSIRSMSRQLQARLGQRRFGRRHRPDAHDVRAPRPPTPHDTSRTSGVSPSSSAFSGRGHDAHRCGVVLAAGVARRHGRVRIILPAERVSACSATRPRCRRAGCSSVSISSSPWRVRTGDRDDLLGEDAVLLRGDRPLVRASPPARPAPGAGCRTGGAGSRRSPACRRAPGSARPPAVVRPRASASCTFTPSRAPPQRMSVE